MIDKCSLRLEDGRVITIELHEGRLQANPLPDDMQKLLNAIFYTVKANDSLIHPKARALDTILNA